MTNTTEAHCGRCDHVKAAHLGHSRASNVTACSATVYVAFSEGDLNYSYPCNCHMFVSPKDPRGDHGCRHCPHWDTQHIPSYPGSISIHCQGGDGLGCQCPGFERTSTVLGDE